MRIPDWKSSARPFLDCDCGDHSFVALTRGHVAILDPDDVEKVWGRNWSAAQRYRLAYAVSEGDEGWQVQMHRVVFDVPSDAHVDHINHNGLDNRKRNLRIATAYQNFANRRAHKGGASRFKGVSRLGEKWGAWIKVNNRNRYLGSFVSEEDAALAYNLHALPAWGDRAYLNVHNRIKDNF
jgi:hypothetical protein